MGDALVPVFIPAWLMTDFSAWLAERISKSGPFARTSPSVAERVAASTGQDVGGWTPDRIDRMVAESPEAMQRILKLLAERAGEWLTTSELAEVLEHRQGSNPSMTVAGTLGAFGRRINHRYAEWGVKPPFEAKWSHEKECMVNRLPKEFAELILRALKKHMKD